MKLRVIATLVAALALGVGSASAQSIGLYFDPGAATCSSTTVMFTPGTMYVLAILSGGDAGGITGAEFRMDGFPNAWFPSANAHAGATTVGSPLTGGTNIAFLCDAGTGGLVTLYTINYFVTSALSDLTVTVNRHTTPSNANFMCPLVTLCDAPAFSARCSRNGEAFINHAGPGCLVGVEPATWSHVKSLYEH